MGTFLQQWKATRLELKFHNFSCVCRKAAISTHNTSEGPLEYDKEVYSFHVLTVGSLKVFGQPSSHLFHLKFSGCFLCIRATRTNVTECIHKKLQLQKIYCTISLKIMLFLHILRTVFHMCPRIFRQIMYIYIQLCWFVVYIIKISQSLTTS